MSHKLEALTVENFRGIGHIEISIDGHNLIVVGENGSGKSSIVDALEYCFTGSIAKLQGRADVDSKNSIPYFGKSPTEITVTCTGEEKPIIATHPKNKKIVPDRLQSFFDLAANRPFVLRRSQLLEFINARPADRYGQISQLIGLSDLDMADKEWRKVKDEAARNLDSFQEKNDHAFSELSDWLEQDINTISKLIQAINAQLGKFNLLPLTQRDQLKERRDSLAQALAVAPDAIETHGQLQRIKGALEEARELVRSLGIAEKDRQKNLAEFLHESHSLKGVHIENLLTNAKEYFNEQESIEECPVCETPVTNPKNLLIRLSERLSSLQTLIDARRELAASTSGVQEQLSVIYQRLKTLTGELASTDFDTIRMFVKSLLDDVPQWQDTLKQHQNFELPLGRLRKWYQESVQFISKISEEIKNQALTADQEAKLAFIETLTRVDQHWQTIEELTPPFKRAAFVSEQLELMYSELIAARKRGLERLREELENDFQYMYHQLHPDEGYGAITLPVYEERRSSVGLDARFHDLEKSHPLNYFSEGHLDSLGLCIFLAFIKRFNDNLKILVFDDVLTTVDAGHRLHVARLLAQEFSEFQIIITTHDKFWARQLEKSLPQSKLFALAQWSPDVGADSQKLLSDWDYYLEQARLGRSQDAVAGAGRNIEKFLGQMRYNLSLAVPARPNDAYTIGDLYGPFFSWINQHQPQRQDRPDFMKEISGLESIFEETWRYRNYAGAHFNEWATSLSTHEAVDFINTMRQLEEAFSCPVCGHLVIYNINNRVLKCPHCPIQPKVKENWLYRSDWREKAERLLKMDKPKVRNNAIPLVQSSWRDFLQDMGRRLQIMVPASPAGQNDVVDLYEPFFDWISNKPLPSVSKRDDFVTDAQRQMADYWQNGRWRDIPISEAENFISAVSNITHRFHCETCQNLLAFDNESDTYYCPNCTDELDSKPVSAYWFVK